MAAILPQSRPMTTAARLAATPLAGGPFVIDTNLYQVFAPDGVTPGGNPIGPSMVPPPNAFRAPNVINGHPGNYVDPAYYSSTIAGGGAQGFENRLLHYSGLVANSYSTIVGGYDLTGCDVYPGALGGAHNRINWAPSGLGPGTVSSSGTAVTGSGTSFTSYGGVGGYLIGGGQILQVSSIASNTAMTTTGSFSPPLSGSAYSLVSTAFVGGNGAGTVTTTGTTTVTGSGTSFTTFFRKGSPIIVGTQLRHVTAIASATSLTTDSAFPTVTSQAYSIGGWQVDHPAYVPNVNTDHCWVYAGTFSAIYNAHYATIHGGTQHSIGWDGVTDYTADAAFIGGGQQNFACAANAAIVGGVQNTAYATDGFIGGGTGNILNAAASYSAAFGSQCSSNSPFTIVAGGNVTVGTTCDYTAAFGFIHAINTARFGFYAGRGHSSAIDNASALGREARCNKMGQFSRSNGQFAQQGDNQVSSYVARWATTDATQTQLAIDGTAVSNSRGVIHSNGTANYTGVQITLKVIALQETTTNFASWNVTMLAIRGASVASMTLVGGLSSATPTQSSGTVTGWNVTTTLSTTNGDLQILVTGAAATNIRWFAEVTSVEVNYP